MVLVTRVEKSRQVILAHAGTSLPPEFARSTPLNHSICQHVAAMDFPLAIDNTVSHPLLKDNLAFAELNVVAYLGAPIHVADGSAMGAICALQNSRRRWHEEDISFILSAASIADELLRAGS